MLASIILFFQEAANIRKKMFFRSLSSQLF